LAKFLGAIYHLPLLHMLYPENNCGFSDGGLALNFNGAPVNKRNGFINSAY
jgi:hypothetical protein